MTANKTRNELKVTDLKTNQLKNKERTKNGGKSSRNCSRKRLRRVTEAPRFEFSSRKTHFSPKIVEMHTKGVRDILKQPPSPIYRGKWRCFPPRGFLRKISKCTQLLSSPPFCTLRKSYESLTEVFRILFSSFFLFPFTNVK